jgi:prepilin-type N-terminal cleavage/methylation domain-containing protein
MKQLKKQKGFTLVEIAIVLIIFGVIASMGLGGLSLYKQTKNDRSARALNSIVNAMQTKMRNDPDTSSMSNVTVINAGVLDKTGWTGSISGGVGTISHLNGGTATFAPATLVTTNDAFTVTMATVPYDSCGDIARDATIHAERITIGSTAVQTSHMTPATGAAIDTACGSAGVVNMVFTYPKVP